ncbi:hypothetical protein fugu_000183 [Takifugu bimaculatus]|uniref:Coiled-coil-domain-containing protein 138 coiled-coil domain-containing protein n=1 Tax=Takifugu bimaculatus TaxID=433685 RepID=A0A4Z2CGD3_9TELE|nr:hypothetical protein fugu_000183 [Takifugu bimaculatus]
MEKPFEGTSETDAVAKLQRKYLDRRTQMSLYHLVWMAALDPQKPREREGFRELVNVLFRAIPHLQCSANVFQEMMAIHTQLKAEHQRQHHFERELQERERRLNQQGEAFVRMDGLQETLETRISALEKKHQQEVSELQERLREQSKENRRLKSNFDTIRELNDNMKKQLNEVREQNKKLVNQSKRFLLGLRTYRGNVSTAWYPEIVLRAPR